MEITEKDKELLREIKVLNGKNEEIEYEDDTTDEDDYYGESKYEDSNVSLF